MKLTKIFDALPVPDYLSMPYAGVSISDSFIRCIQFGHHKGGAYIEKYNETPIPEGAISAGQINNKDEIINILKTLKNDLRLGYVRASLPEEKAFLFTSRIPIVKSEEVPSVVESKIETNVPVSPRELIFDYKLIDHRSQGHLDIVVSALPAVIVASYVALFEEAELPLLSLEIESQAVARATLPPDSAGTVLIVHFGREKVSLYVISARVVRFTSTIPLGGELINDPSFLSQEVKKLYIYWHTLKENTGKPEKKIEEIIVCGESFPESMVSELASHNNATVSLANVWRNVLDVNDVVPEISFTNSLRYAPSIGLALPSEILI